MSKKAKTTDEEREQVENGQLVKPEGQEVDVPEPPTNAEATKNFILTRGGMISAHDEEAIGSLLTWLGMDPAATAETPPAAGPQEGEEKPAEVPPVGDGQPAPEVNEY